MGCDTGSVERLAAQPTLVSKSAECWFSLSVGIIDNEENVQQFHPCLIDIKRQKQTVPTETTQQ